jgi:hypothetical protein
MEVKMFRTVFSAIALVALSTVAHASDRIAPPNTCSAVNTGMWAGLYTGPGAEFAMVTKLQAGDLVQEHEYHGNWIHATVNGQDGWVSGKLTTSALCEAQEQPEALAPRRDASPPRPLRAPAELPVRSVVPPPVTPVTPVTKVNNDVRSFEPSQDEIRTFASKYMKDLSAQKLSEREIANQLATTIYLLEKIQLVCPSYFYVNALATRYDYLMRQGTWSMMFGVGKTSTSILNEASARRNEEFNNSVSKKEYCERTKAFGTKMFGWD